MRWLMSLGERTRPDAPTYAEAERSRGGRSRRPGPGRAPGRGRGWEWQRTYGEELTAWAVQVEAEDVENLPAELIEQWEWEGAPVRLDIDRGGYVKVSDYRDVSVRPGIHARTTTGLPLWTITP